MDGAEPILTSLPHDDSRRFLYSYLGKRMRCRGERIYYADDNRSRPTLVGGVTGSGKTELLIALAVQDSAKGRPVVYIDGKCEMKTLQKLYYYTHHVLKRRFYVLTPTTLLDGYTHSWNPLISSQLESRTITESIFNAFRDPQVKQDSGVAFYTEFQRTVFSHLMMALRFSKYAVCMQDLLYALEYDDLLSKLPSFLKPEGMVPYAELLKMRNEEGRNFGQNLKSFLNYLRLFDHWSLNSYNPVIRFDAMMLSDSVIYVGLPVNAQKYLMSCIGNIIINQLKALSQYVQSHYKHKRHFINCTVDEAGSFVDTGLPDWLCKSRTSGFSLTLGVHMLADLEGRRPGFAKQVQGNTPNICMFRNNDKETAEWFSDLGCHELGEARAANIKAAGSDLEETGAGSTRASEQRRVPPDSIKSLRTGQCYFLSSALNRPILLAACYLPDPPDRPERQYVRSFDTRPPEMSGLNLSYFITSERIRMSNNGKNEAVLS